jgi:hypothetical protein
MNLPRACKSTRALAAATLLLLSGTVLTGCSIGLAQEAPATRVAADVTDLVDRETFGGDVQFRISNSFEARGQTVPFDLVAGLAPVSPTRLGVQGIIDLRGLQQALPQLLSGRLEPSCTLSLDVDFHRAEADGDKVQATATVDARMFRCRDGATAVTDRGAQLLSQTIDVTATVRERLDGRCLRFDLVDLQLAPRGVLGRLANLFGVTERARTALSERAEAILRDRPICPAIPEAIAVLDPRIGAVRFTEIGAGGMAASLSGSVDVSAASLLALLAVESPQWRAPDSTEADTNLALRVDDSVEVLGRDVAFGADLALTAASQTRIGFDVLLDLQGLQDRLPEISAGVGILDVCGVTITLDRAEVGADGATFLSNGRLRLQRYECERLSPDTWQRREPIGDTVIAVEADIATEVADNCVRFTLAGLEPDDAADAVLSQIARGELAAARAIVEDTARLYLDSAPICLDLPPDLEALDPRFDLAEPREIGEGGLGVALDGSVEVGPVTVVEVLRLLQERGTLPPAP